jgi:hypothetical protein
MEKNELLGWKEYFDRGGTAYTPRSITINFIANQSP